MDANPVCSQCGQAIPKEGKSGDICTACQERLESEQVTLVDQDSCERRGNEPLIQELAPHFPQLEILDLLGQGGMGYVFKARQVSLDRLVALKILSPELCHDESFAQRFSQEARSLAQLHHPNIVAVHDFGKAGPYFYLLMEFVDGQDLRGLLRGRQVDLRSTMKFIPEICSALQYAHDHRIVHRDIKPENILINVAGTIKIADFGLSRLADNPLENRLTQVGSVVGTPRYMAPEQFDAPDEADHRADIYALGVVFYELLTGDLPVGSFDPPSVKAKTDERLDAVILRALANRPADRYEKASDIGLDVENISGLVSQVPAALRDAVGYEYRSRRKLFGVPLIHVATGVDLKTGKGKQACGIVAIGHRAKGVVAIGTVAYGFFAFGAIGIGVLSFSSLAIGLFSLGGIAIGLVAGFGALAVAPIAMGALASGVYASGALAFGLHAVGGNVQDVAASEFFHRLPGGSPVRFIITTLVSSLVACVVLVGLTLGMERLARRRRL